MGPGDARHRIVLLSGGLDSAAALYLGDAQRTLGLFVDYGQTSVAGELRAATALAEARGVLLSVVTINAMAALGAGTLSGQPRAEGADGTTEDQQDEWFPARNVLLAAVGAVMIGHNGGGQLVFGAQTESYRDARPEFFASAQRLIADALPTSFVVSVVVPPMARLDALRAASAQGLNARLTFSCNRRGDRHCWRCASCRDRQELLGRLRQSQTMTGWGGPGT